MPHEEWRIISLFFDSDRFIEAGVLAQTSRPVTIDVISVRRILGAMEEDWL
jgi:hypothetical protein